MQLSELVKMIFNIIAGPTDVFEDCDQAQSIISKMKQEEEDIAQGKEMWKADELLRSIISGLCGK